MRPRLLAARLMLAFALSRAVTGCAPELGNPWLLVAPDVPGDPDAPAWPSDQPVGLRRDAGSDQDGQIEADAADASTPTDGGPGPSDSPEVSVLDVSREDAPLGVDVLPAPEDRSQPADVADVTDVADATDAHDAGAPSPDVAGPQDAGVRDAPADLSPDAVDAGGAADAPDAPDVTDVRDVGADVGVDAGVEDRPQPDVVDVPVSCGTGTERCGATCADIRTSVEHCGVCGRSCSPGEVCTEGRCHDLPCGTSAGWYLCGSACVDVSRSDDHCGRCRSPCGAGLHCRLGLCGR
jgi:hypothetical protein